MNQPKHYMIDLFCGAGGLSNGLEAAGFQCLLGIDFDKNAIKTFKSNHKHAEAITGDLREISKEQIKKWLGGKKVKLVCGGPPCQGFSTVGTNDANDQRNHLFLEFVRVVKDLEPDYILLENVTGLLSRRNQNTLISIIRCFTDLGYQIDVKVLSAHNFGVPQRRRRTIFLANRLGIVNMYPKKQFEDVKFKNVTLPKPHDVKWAFNNLIYHNGVAFNHNTSDAEIKKELEKKRLHHVPSGKSIRYEEDQINYLPTELWFDVEWDKIQEKRFRQAQLHRLDFNDCSPTINTSKTTYYHPTEDRYLTPREAAAIQSFPADFIFHGTVSQQWRQIGNAVPPILGRALGEAILEMDLNKQLIGKARNIGSIADIRKKAFNYQYDVYPDDEKEQLEFVF